MTERMHVPAKPAAPPQVTRAPFGALQRKCACGGSGGDCEACKKKKGALQRHAVPGANRGTGFPPVNGHGRDGHGASAAAREGGGVPPIVHDVLDSPGQALDAATRAFFEPRFGHDFSKVRVHTGARAARSAQAVQAHAYTVGRDVVFGAGQYAPGTAAGNHLLAHELVHVVQQGRGTPGDVRPQSISSPTDSAEREADTLGRACLSGPVAPAQAASPAGLFRLGANPNCTQGEADSIHQGIFDARGWLNKAIPALEQSPLGAKALASLRKNFGPTYGVPANAQLIHDRLVAARNAVGTIPYSCATAPADATCAAGNCGYTPGAGSHRATICSNVTLAAGTSSVFRAGCVLHESFHATFARMDVDFYSGWHGHSSSTAGYPGGGVDPLLNADSYTTLVMDLS